MASSSPSDNEEGTPLRPFLPSSPSPPLSPSRPSYANHSSQFLDGTSDPDDDSLPNPSPSVEIISGFPRIHTGTETERPSTGKENSSTERPNIADTTSTTADSVYMSGGSGSEMEGEKKEEDPFAAYRGSGENGENVKGVFGRPERKEGGNEWDASKTAPSSFQKPAGSAFATPATRDGHVDKNYGGQEKEEHHASLVEKGWAKMTGRNNSKAEKE